MTRLTVASEVADALAAGGPVVALESTIISHGFPYPANLEFALTAEEVVRGQGAVPATIAVLGGVPTVGLSRQQIEHLATAGPERVEKVSRRDLGVGGGVGRGVDSGAGRAGGDEGRDGATTVAATMLLARLAGIDVFATGGIGGVHRGAERSFDVSADLMELARTEVCVVCAGAKSILDIGLTLEVLETHGVPVLGYRTDEFPSFYTRTSGLPVSARLDSAADIARAFLARRDLRLGGGMVVANPIDREHEIAPAELDSWTAQAFDDAAVQGIRGKAVTPFLLARIHALSAGASEEANKQLVYSNARLAAQIAAEIAAAARIEPVEPHTG